MSKIKALMEYETAGDPMTGLRWTHKTLSKLSEELKRFRIPVSPNTVGRLLKSMNFTLKANRKQIASGLGKKKPSREERDIQFHKMAGLRKRYERNHFPVISVDTKKKEQVGQFKNPGRVWAKTGALVNDHDFRSDSVGVGIPYGIYDTVSNRGSIYLGVSRDTPSFAVECVARWWRQEGCKLYSEAEELLILADSGGSNGARSRVWKYELQEKLCDRYGIKVRVAHYPVGTSKWNPIEHRLFSEISKNWAGRPLDSYETMKKYIQSTTTQTGLTVKAKMVWNKFKTGKKIPDEQMDTLKIRFGNILPQWNYTIKPR